MGRSRHRPAFLLGTIMTFVCVSLAAAQVPGPAVTIGFGAGVTPAATVAGQRVNGATFVVNWCDTASRHLTIERFVMGQRSTTQSTSSDASAGRVLTERHRRGAWSGGLSFIGTGSIGRVRLGAGGGVGLGWFWASTTVTASCPGPGGMPCGRFESSRRTFSPVVQGVAGVDVLLTPRVLAFAQVRGLYEALRSDDPFGRRASVVAGVRVGIR